MRLALIVLLAGGIAMPVASCAGAKQPALKPTPAPAGATLWEAPASQRTQDLFYGPWGRDRSPDPEATYTVVERKHSGVNLGMTVVDTQGRKWSVKQAYPGGLDDEGPVEVVVSRLLSASGYHQPPVYYLRTIKLRDDWGTRSAPGGRFRLDEETLKETGSWRWEENPFIGTRPYRGLLALMMMFNNTDMKNSNNSLYEVRNGNSLERWYVVRDLGAALGDTHRFAPRKGHAEAFERQPFILGVSGRHVEFAYSGWYQKLVRDRISVEDVAWAGGLLARLSDSQWRDAFRAGDYEPAVANRFIRTLRAKLEQSQALAR